MNELYNQVNYRVSSKFNSIQLKFYLNIRNVNYDILTFNIDRGIDKITTNIVLNVLSTDVGLLYIDIREYTYDVYSRNELYKHLTKLTNL